MTRIELPSSIRSDTLNIAASLPATQVLGPGWRAAVWVQGCPFRCPGCIAPGWLPNRPARLVSAHQLAEELLADERVTGWTISGGEPMLQAKALVDLVRAGRRLRAINVIVFSGYELSHLKRMPSGSGVPRLLEMIDVLIDGPYRAELNDNRGLRGSSNQTVHYLTDRLVGSALEGSPRRVEVLVRDGELMFAGVPPVGVFSAVMQDITALREKSLAAGGLR